MFLPHRSLRTQSLNEEFVDLKKRHRLLVSLVRAGVADREWVTLQLKSVEKSLDFLEIRLAMMMEGMEV